MKANVLALSQRHTNQPLLHVVVGVVTLEINDGELLAMTAQQHVEFIEQSLRRLRRELDVAVVNARGEFGGPSSTGRAPEKEAVRPTTPEVGGSNPSGRSICAACGQDEHADIHVPCSEPLGECPFPGHAKDHAFVEAKQSDLGAADRASDHGERVTSAGESAGDPYDRPVAEQTLRRGSTRDGAGQRLEIYLATCLHCGAINVGGFGKSVRLPDCPHITLSGSHLGPVTQGLDYDIYAIEVTRV